MLPELQNAISSSIGVHVLYTNVPPPAAVLLTVLGHVSSSEFGQRFPSRFSSPRS